MNESVYIFQFPVLTAVCSDGAFARLRIVIALSRYHVAGYECFKTIKFPRSPTFSMGFDRKAYSNVLKIFDICLELPSD